MADEADARDLRERTKDLEVTVLSGMDGLLAVAREEQAEILVTAIVGMMGIRPTIAAIEAEKDIALANKETLVTAGHIIMPLAKEKGVKILPVDSEHSAIFQSLQGEAGNEIEKILLTASGGPFRGKTYEELEHVKVEDALRHPNWSMGRKITVDSATMVNKGLEVMEAKWLFGVSPGSGVRRGTPSEHSSLGGGVCGRSGHRADGCAGYAPPDYLRSVLPEEENAAREKSWTCFSVGTLTFEKPDLETFYGLALAYDAMRAGGNVPTVFNAANERAVAKFLDGKIRFLEIPEMISEAMTEVDYIAHPGLEEILSTEQATYEYIESRW